jgi:hypothetical protein
MKEPRMLRGVTAGLTAIPRGGKAAMQAGDASTP